MSAVADPPANEQQVEAAVEPVLEADGQISFAVGGKKPQASSLAFTGGKVAVEGQFDKGVDVDVLITGRVHDVGFKDTLDPKTKQATTCDRRQKAQIIACVRATPDNLIARAVELLVEAGAGRDELNAAYARALDRIEFGD